MTDEGRFGPPGAAGLLERAKGVLAANWLGEYTKPAPRLYPHQWNWDSGFVAIGYARYAPDRARAELRSLFRGQWRNGMLPHIVFDPAGTEYFPGPDFWEVERSGEAPEGVPTSGITNPPVHAWVALRICELAGDEPSKALLRELFPKIRAMHRYLYEHRDPEREGLAYIRHPWESGTDNSPTWDEPLGRIDLSTLQLAPYRRKDLGIVSADQRPTEADYDRYVHLLEVYKRASYDERRLSEECPFRVQDPLFNAILCRAGEALVEIAGVLGEDAGELLEWHAQTRRGIESKLWDETAGLYASFDLLARNRLPAGSIAGLLPLFAGVPNAARAKRLLERLESPSFSGRGGDVYRVPSYDLTREAFEATKYWRGPVWVNTNWMIVHGLRRYGFRSAAHAVRADTLEVVDRFGFHEYFSPHRSAGRGRIGGLGSPDFSWTAALWIDLWAEENGV